MEFALNSHTHTHTEKNEKYRPCVFKDVRNTAYNHYQLMKCVYYICFAGLFSFRFLLSLMVTDFSVELVKIELHLFPKKLFRIMFIGNIFQGSRPGLWIKMSLRQKYVPFIPRCTHLKALVVFVSVRGEHSGFFNSMEETKHAGI